jgi:hypothetical protein
MNNDELEFAYSGTKSSGWLGHWQQKVCSEQLYCVYEQTEIIIEQLNTLICIF